MKEFNRWIGHNRTFISLVLALAVLLMSRPTPVSVSWGFPLILVGELIRTWAAGCINKEYEELTTWGPYAITRNPLYIGNFLLGLGFVIMGNVAFMILLFAVLFFMIYRATIFDEEQTLLSVFGDSFRRYQAEVPRFFPKLHIPDKPLERFDWKKVMKHREYKAWIGIVIILGFLWLKLIIMK
jgi:protein-S-isoprenylcysteine O-methyltransferase Ste14